MFDLKERLIVERAKVIESEPKCLHNKTIFTFRHIEQARREIEDELNEA